MNNLENPFYHRGAIRHAQHFLGREAETAQILGLLRNGQSVSLIGPRRIGKSSLFLHLCRPEVREPFNLAPPRALFVMVDCQELGGSPPDEVYEVMLQGLQDAAANLTLTPPIDGDSYRTLDRILHQITQQGVSVVMMLDEFELLASNEQLTPYFFARLRGLTTKYGLAYLTASQHPLFLVTADEKILSSPFFNIFVTLPLGLMSEEEARALLIQRLQNTSVSFPPNVIDHILHLVGPHPFFLHVAGYHIFQMLADNPAAATDFDTLDTPIEIESESHLGYLWQNLNQDAQYALAICDGPVDIMRMLEQQCLITPTENGYHYTSELLRRFIRRQQVEGLIQAGPFVIDPQKHQVKANGQEISLTTSQFDILVCLGKHMNDVVHGEALEMAVWGDTIVKDPDRLKTLIKRLRRAIEPYGNWIVSERGVGYALRPPLESEQ